MSDDLKGWLFGRVLRLQEGPPGRPWRLSVFKLERARFEDVGALHTPLLAPGGAPLAAEMVVLPGDPPDAVTVAGDFVWLRRYQPNFTVAPNGDLTLVEGA